MDSNREKKQIIFIVGMTHSGSSIAARLFNTSDASINIGEVNSLSRYFRRDTKCSCGKSISECSFWRRIKKQNYSIRKRHLLRFNTVRTAIKNNKYLFNHIFNEYRDVEIIIDNSKNFLRAAILSASLRDEYDFLFVAPKRSFTAMYKSLKKRQKNKINGIDQKYPFLFFLKYPMNKIVSFLLKIFVRAIGYKVTELKMKDMWSLVDEPKFNLTKIDSKSYKINDYLNHSIGGSQSSRGSLLRI